MNHPHRLVIVGSGMAGARLVENVLARKGTREFDIVVLGDEPGGTYNRILLSGVLAGAHAGPDIVTNPTEWYASNGVALHAGERVAQLDLDARNVVTSSGRRYPYDSVVLATGSRPILPPIERLTTDDGSLTTGAFVFRTVDDCARIAVAAASARKAVVIGGGLLGLEAARGLLGYDLDVTVVHLAGHLMDAQLDCDAGHVLGREFEALGVRVKTGRVTTRVIGQDEVEGVEFNDGSRLACDLLIVAAGVRPNVELALACGLRTGRGVIVDDDLSCRGAEDVYAIGDCAEHRGQAYGLVAPAWEQADVLADRLTGRRADALYRGSRLATKLKVAGLDVAVMGERDARVDDEVVCYTEPARGIYCKVIVRDDCVVGATLIGAAAAVPTTVQRFLDRSPAPAQRSELLFPQTGDAPARSVDQIPDAARICDCNAVAKAEIVDAVSSGARSLRAVCETTRAGTGCGSCRPEVQRIIDFVCRDAQEASMPDTHREDDAVGPVQGENHATT